MIIIDIMSAEQRAKKVLDDFIFGSLSIDGMHDYLIEIVKETNIIPKICFDPFYSQHMLWIQFVSNLIDENDEIIYQLPKNDLFIISIVRSKNNITKKLINEIDNNFIDLLKEKYPDNFILKSYHSDFKIGR